MGPCSNWCLRFTSLLCRIPTSFVRSCTHILRIWLVTNWSNNMILSIDAFSLQRVTLVEQIQWLLHFYKSFQVSDMTILIISGVVILYDLSLFDKRVFIFGKLELKSMSCPYLEEMDRECAMENLTRIKLKPMENKIMYRIPLPGKYFFWSALVFW